MLKNYFAKDRMIILFLGAVVFTAFIPFFFGRIIFESDVISSLVRSVIDDIGFSFLPLIYVTKEIKENSITVLGPDEGYWKYRIWLACHEQNKGDSLIQTFAQSFGEVCAQAHA